MHSEAYLLRNKDGCVNRAEIDQMAYCIRILARLAFLRRGVINPIKTFLVELMAIAHRDWKPESTCQDNTRLQRCQLLSMFIAKCKESRLTVLPLYVLAQVFALSVSDTEEQFEKLFERIVVIVQDSRKSKIEEVGDEKLKKQRVC